MSRCWWEGREHFIFKNWQVGHQPKDTGLRNYKYVWQIYILVLVKIQAKSIDLAPIKQNFAQQIIKLV